MRKDVELSAFTMHLKEINAVEPVGAEDIRERYRFDVNSSNKTTTVRWIERMSITLVLRNPQSLNTSLSTDRLSKRFVAVYRVNRYVLLQKLIIAGKRFITDHIVA